MCNEVAMSKLRTEVMIDGEQLEYKYLGRLVTSGNEISKEIAQRITQDGEDLGNIATFEREKDPYLPEEKHHGYSHLTSYDLWCRDIGSNKTSKEEAWRDRC